MAEIINMPKLGFDMAEGILVRWVKKVGETVGKGEVLAEIETDKATVEVESSASGVVRKFLVEEGAVVPVNSPIAVVGTADEIISEQVPESRGKSTTSSPMPVVQAQPEIPPAKSTTVDLQSTIKNQQSEILKVSPLAKNIARQRGVDLGHIQGTGPGGRIVRRDVEAALASQEARVATPMLTDTTTRDYSTIRLSDQTLPLSKLRQAIARRMAEAKTTIPHFYVTHEYKVDALLDLRRQVNDLQPEDAKISINDFIIKAVALTLRQFPNLNSSLNGNSVFQHGSINIGIAVSIEGGLLTVVCRDADQKSLPQISSEVKTMAAHVREGKVRPEEIEGSTFSISNMGMYDVENFSAIINPPEAAILAVASARQVPVIVRADGVGADGVRPDGIRPGWRMKATISVDHRVSDGVEAAKFMQALAVKLEEPLRLLL